MYETYVKVLEDVYRDSTVTLKLDKVTKKIQIKKSVGQGNTISPISFTAVLKKGRT